MIFEYLLLAWWFSLPAYVANICPGLARTLPYGKIPVSVNYLGPNKTWMAFPSALIGACVIAWTQGMLTYPQNYPEVTCWVAGACFGFGTVLGDWAKSLAKRRLGIAPGGKWWVEKIDFLIMSFILLTLTEGALPLQYYLVPILFYGLVHGPGNRLSYKLGWRNSPH